MSSTLMQLSRDKFLHSVLELRPAMAVFDCDGTLWEHDSGELFLNWEIEHGILPPEIVAAIRPRYADYKRGLVDEDTMCGEMVAIHKGLSNSRLDEAAAEFVQEKISRDIFPEMLELTRRLSHGGCQLWAVSSTNDWVVRAGAASFGIAAERVLAASVYIENGYATDRLVRVPSGAGKALAIRECMPRIPECVFGNSLFDREMLQLAPHPFAINPNPDLEELAKQRGWVVYKPSRQ